MISFIKRLFLNHWQRKLISLILAIIIWLVTNHSMTVSKTISGVAVRIQHLPQGKTIEGMLGSGLLNTKLSLNINGNKDCLEELTAKNLEVVIDAEGQPDQWVANISKKNIRCLNPNIDIGKAVAKVSAQELILKQTRLVSEKVPVLITQPIGEPPSGYQFLDVWPYQLSLTVNGPEELVKKLKRKGIKLTFNLSEISKSELDALQDNGSSDEISFLIPQNWKKLHVPQLSHEALEIDDPQSKYLRIDFSRQEFLPTGTSLPITVFFPAKYSDTLNPDTYSISTNEYVVKKNGVKVLSVPLYSQGISRLFLETVKDMIQITAIAAPKSERDTLVWNVQFMSPQELENRYISKMLSEHGAESMDILPHMREEYLRNRFRRYMSKFRFYTANHQKLNLKIELQANTISVVPANDL